MREIKIIGLYLTPFLLSLNPQLHHTASRCRMASYYRPALFRLGSGAGRHLWPALALVLFAINGAIYATSVILAIQPNSHLHFSEPLWPQAKYIQYSGTTQGRQLHGAPQLGDEPMGYKSYATPRLGDEHMGRVLQQFEHVDVPLSRSSQSSDGHTATRGDTPRHGNVLTSTIGSLVFAILCGATGMIIGCMQRGDGGDAGTTRGPY